MKMECTNIQYIYTEVPVFQLAAMAKRYDTCTAVRSYVVVIYILQFPNHTHAVKKYTIVTILLMSCKFIDQFGL